MFMRLRLVDQGGERGSGRGLKRVRGDSSLRNRPESRWGKTC